MTASRSNKLKGVDLWILLKSNLKLRKMKGKDMTPNVFATFFFLSKQTGILETAENCIRNGVFI